MILIACEGQLATVSLEAVAADLLLLQLEAALDLQQPEAAAVAAAALDLQQPEAAALAAMGHPEAEAPAHEAGQAVLVALSSKAPRVVLVSAFWAQPAIAIATQIPIVASMVFIGLGPLPK